MTIADTSSYVIYAANGSNLIYSYAFQLFDEDDLEVALYNPSANMETIASPATYTVSEIEDPDAGGTVTFLTAPAGGLFVILRRKTAISQELALSNQRSWQPKTLELALDRMVQQVQQLRDQVARTLQLQFGDTRVPDDVLNALLSGTVTVVAPVVRLTKFTVGGTWTPDVNMVSACIECVGAGGGGGGAQNSTAGAYGGGGGGGGGGYSRRVVTKAQAGSSQAVTVGTGGTAGNGTTPTNAGAGGATSVGALCIANGGSGATTAAPNSRGGAGGGGVTAGAIGDVVIGGGSGNGGGSSSILTVIFPNGAMGGRSILGSGGGAADVGVTGRGSTGFGGGGGGGSSYNGGGAVNGSGGGGGIAIITEYCTI